MIGVLGVVAGGSPSGTESLGLESFTAAVWGDTGDSVVPNSWDRYGIVGTASDGIGGFFSNNSSLATIQAYNYDGSTTSFFKTFSASTPAGTCGIGGAGDLTCTGQVKSIVTTAKARQVETYSMQSPENWLEDFGSGSIQNGTAAVAIDPAFADAINQSVDYHVFLSPRGDSKGLYVTNVTATGFEVRESGGGKSSLAFDYRIVAKRHGMERQRLVDVTERLQAEIQAVRPKPRPIAPASKSQAAAPLAAPNLFSSSENHDQ